MLQAPCSAPPYKAFATLSPAIIAISGLMAFEVVWRERIKVKEGKDSSQCMSVWPGAVKSRGMELRAQSIQRWDWTPVFACEV